MPHQLKDPTATAVGFNEEDFIDLGEGFATIVQPDPRSGVMGFVSFSYDEFIDYSKALVIDVRNDMLEDATRVNNDTDVLIAKAVITALNHQLYMQYGALEFEWPTDDQYVALYQSLDRSVRDYERPQQLIYFDKATHGQPT